MAGLLCCRQPGAGALDWIGSGGGRGGGVLSAGDHPPTVHVH